MLTDSRRYGRRWVRKAVAEMEQAPLCQFGPGGEYSRSWPESEKPYVSSCDPAPGDLIASQAERMGLQAPLVSVGPQPIQWTRRSLAERGARDAGVGSEHDAARSAELRESAGLLSRALGALGRMLIGNGLEPDKVLAAGSPPIEQVAMSAAHETRIHSDEPFTVVAVDASQENANDNCKPEKQNGYAETTGNTEIHQRLSYPQRLFPDDAGDRGLLASNKSHRVRTRSRSGKKRSAAARRKAQGSLFAGF